jgi:hypothetical protein
MVPRIDYRDGRWLVDDLFDPIGVNDDELVPAKTRRRIIALWLSIGTGLHEIRLARSIRLPRNISTYAYTGDLLLCVDNVHPDPRRRWNTYPQDQRDALWLDEFRMIESDFDELFQMVALHMTQPQAINPQFRRYSRRHKLLMTLNWLAHVPTTRQMRNKFNVPHNSFNTVVLRPTVKVLYQVLFESQDTLYL